MLYSPEMVIAVIEIRCFTVARSRTVPHLKEDAPQRSLRGGRAEAQDVLGIQPELKLTDHYHMTSMAISGTQIGGT